MKILVATSSRHGATAEIAAAIARTFRTSGLDVKLADASDVSSLDGFDAFVIGSGIYMGRWLDPARRLVLENADAFRSRPVWLFSSGPLGDPAKPEGDPTEIPALTEASGALGHATFPGACERSKLGLGEKAIAAMVRIPDGDWRPGPEIGAWAGGIAARLLQH